MYAVSRKYAEAMKIQAMSEMTAFGLMALSGNLTGQA